MTDPEIIRRCAEAYFAGRLSYGPQISQLTDGKAFVEPDDEVEAIVYDPLHDDAQAMALVKKFELGVRVGEHQVGEKSWVVCRVSGPFLAQIKTVNVNLNRAICECVAKMGEAK